MAFNFKNFSIQNVRNSFIFISCMVEQMILCVFLPLPSYAGWSSFYVSQSMINGRKIHGWMEFLFFEASDTMRAVVS